MKSCNTWNGETAQVHRASWAFPTGACAHCGGREYDPDRLYCETCTQVMGIQIAEEAGDLPAADTLAEPDDNST